MADTELDRLIAEALASCEGFNAGDVAAWMNPFHDDAMTFNNGFTPLALIKPMAADLIHGFKSFNISNVDGRIVDDTAILFGDYSTEFPDGRVTTGAFTFSFVRTNGEWKNLLSHYTPLETTT